MLNLFSSSVFLFSFTPLLIYVIYIFWVWEFGIPNWFISNSVTDLNFGLFQPMRTGIFFLNNPCIFKLLIIISISMFDMQYWKHNNVSNTWKISKNYKSYCGLLKKKYNWVIIMQPIHTFCILNHFKAC